MNAQNPREIAARILRQRRAGGEFTENLLGVALAGARLSSNDRRLCQELVYGIVRWQATLDWLIARKTDSRDQKTGLQNLLRLGLYQIFWLDCIPPHAAVHETVELAKQGGFGPQAGFLNAILRGYLREAGATRKLLAELKISRSALGFSHPEWLVEKWRFRFGDEKMRLLLDWNNTPPKTFARVNALKFESRAGVSPTQRGRQREHHVGFADAGRRDACPTLRNAGDLLACWRDENVEYDFVRRDWLAENLVFELKSHPPLNSLASFRDGWFYIQDPSTLLAVTELDPHPGETILDSCAAPGGKTGFIAQLIQNRGHVVASDISEDRLKLIRENCARLGVTCVEFCSSRDNEAQTLKAESGNRKAEMNQSLLTSAAAKFDRILVDAPCSNTGVMRRRVDLRWRISLEEISWLQRAQLDLLRLAAAKLKLGGILVYSTCSLEPEENGEVVKAFLREHPNFKLEAERELLPFVDQVDGAFVARMKKFP